MNFMKMMLLSPLCILSVAIAQDVEYFSDNGFSNPISTMQHPCAEHYKDTTYIAYSGPHEDPYVCAYNHASGQWFGPVRAGVNPMGKTPDPMNKSEVDDHGRPALIVDDAGYIHLVFGGHGGDRKYGRNALGRPGKGKQTHVVSSRPEDISSWEVLDNISPFGTYSQFVKMDNGDLYLFYRHGSHRSNWVYQKSTDNGRNFASPVSVLLHKTQESDPNIHDAWYAWFENGKGDTITASYVYHPCKILDHTRERYNGYYMQMNGADETWTNVQGKALSMPVTKESADTQTLVCDTGEERSSRGICRMDSDGNPHLFFRQGSGQVRYYRWLGSTWQGPSVITEESRSQDGDMSVESPEVVRILLAQSNSGRGEVCWWKTTDGGLHWQKENCLIASPAATYRASALVRNAHPDGRMVVSENSSSQNHLYRKMYLLGDSGPVKRPKEEAENLGDRLKNRGMEQEALPNEKKAHTPQKKSGDTDE